MAFVVYTLPIASSVISGVSSSKSASSAANKQKKWRQRAIDEEARQYDTTREDFAPWREAGQNALARLGRASTGDMSDFQTSPGYQFRLDEGTRNLENRFSAKGGGGNAMRALNEYSQNFASNEFGNWWNRQAGLSGVGQSATGQTTMAGMNAANNISGQYGMLGDNLASIGLWNAGNQNNALRSGLSNVLYGLDKPSTQGSTWGTGPKGWGK